MLETRFKYSIYIHWASKETYNFLEWCPLKSTALKWMIFKLILATVLLITHVKKQRNRKCQQWDKCLQITTSPFSKITETAHFPPRRLSNTSIAIHSNSIAGYVIMFTIGLLYSKPIVNMREPVVVRVYSSIVECPPPPPPGAYALGGIRTTDPVIRAQTNTLQCFHMLSMCGLWQLCWEKLAIKCLVKGHTHKVCIEPPTLWLEVKCTNQHTTVLSYTHAWFMTTGLVWTTAGLKLFEGHQGHGLWCPFDWLKCLSKNSPFGFGHFGALFRSSHLCCISYVQTVPNHRW